MALVRRMFFAIAILSTLALPFTAAHAAMTSANYQVLWDSIGIGGGDDASSSSYTLRDSLTMGAAGTVGTSSSYRESYGYRMGVYDPVVDFSLFSANKSTQVAATGLAGSDVTVTTSAGFLPGQRIAVVQDEGASQVVAMGKITAIASTTITVDAWTVGGTSPTIDGNNDYVYVLATDGAIDLGTLSTTTVATSVISWEASADVSQGYSVYFMENADLGISGGDAVGDVADGAVTAGASEYGAISSDQSLALSTFDTQDTAITSSMQQVASRSDNSFSSRDFLILKVAAGSSLSAGTYSNTMTAVFVGDY